MSEKTAHESYRTDEMPCPTQHDYIHSEKQAPSRLVSEGYHHLSIAMAAYPACGIFRRFGALYIRRALYLQAELATRERSLNDYAAQDFNSPDPYRQDYCRNFDLLRQGVTDPDYPDKNNLQYEEWKKIGSLLKEYREAIQSARIMIGIGRPDKLDMKFLKDAVLKHGDIALTGSDRELWNETSSRDLLALRIKNHNDTMSEWISLLVAPFHRCIGYRFKKPDQPIDSPLFGLSMYEGRWMDRFHSVLVVCLASFLPILAIFVLDRVLGKGLRLGLMAILTTIFSVIMLWFTGDKKGQIFIGSILFTAVQTFFMSEEI